MSEARSKRLNSQVPGWRRQRGASAILVAVMLFALLSALLATLDVGRLYLAQRDLQRLANLSALDGAREIGGCRGPVADPQAVAAAAVRSSVQANGGNVAILDHSLSSVELGVVTRSAGIRSFSASPPDEAVAVNVTLVDPAPQRILPMFSTGAGNLRAQAAAFSAPVAALSVGTSLASLDATDSAVLNAVLGGLLGVPPGGLALDALSYQGLAGAQVTLQQLVDTGVIVGGVEDFLATEISVPTFLEAVGEALGTLDPALGAIVDQIAAVADPARRIIPGLLFPVEQGLESAGASLPINVGDLLGAVALVATQGAPVNLLVPISLPGVASTNLRMKVIEPPQFGGPGRPGFGANGQPRVQAHTAQALMQLDMTLNPINVNLPPLTSINLTVDLHLYMTLAQATATMTGLNCANPMQPFHSVTVDVSTDLATVGMGEFDDLAAANPQPVAAPPLVNTSLNILTLPPIGLRVDATAGPIDAGTSQDRELQFQGPFVPKIQQPSPDNTKRVGTPMGDALNTALADLAASLNLNVTLNLPAVGVLVKPLLDTVAGLLRSEVPPALVGAINPILSTLDDVLMNPLLDILGLDLGAADVTVESVRISQPDPFGAGDRPYVELISH